MTVDGYEEPIELKAALTISDGGIHVDYAGTSPHRATASTCRSATPTPTPPSACKCIVATRDPEQCRLARHRDGERAGRLDPACAAARAVTARHAVGQMLPDVMFGCLHQALGGGTPAEGAASLWGMPLFGGPGIAPGTQHRPTSRASR